jgi:hypothetical protein
MVTVNGLLQDIKKGSVWGRHIFSRKSPRRSHEKVNDHIDLFLLDFCIMLGQNPSPFGYSGEDNQSWASIVLMKSV